MGKPSIALLHYTTPPIVGGVENVMAEHARLLRGKGYPVMIVAGRGSTEKPFGDPEIAIIPELDSQHPRNLKMTQDLVMGRQPAEFEEFAGLIESRLEPLLQRADHVLVHNVFNFHFNLPFTAALHRLLDRRLPPRFTAWCHDISRYVNPASGSEQRRGYPWDLLRTYRPELAYVAVSRRRQRALASVLGCDSSQIRVIPNGADSALLLGLSGLVKDLAQELRLADADLIMLMPVRITRAKNLEFALRVTAAIRAAHVRVRLIVTGPPDPHAADGLAYYDTLLALRERLDLRQEVQFLFEGTARHAGPLIVGAESVAELYRISDLVLMPSLREGFGLPVLEAGLVGKPVFSTDV
ncbi:MAG: glycosyltransferase family 4 protein, partial [Rudaea sp.]